MDPSMLRATKIACYYKLKALFPLLADLIEDFKMVKQVRKWRRHGWKTPVNGLIKRVMIKAEARRIAATSLVETGTLHGDTVWFFRNEMEQIISIELAPVFAAAARARFASWPNVTIVEGDSAEKLPDIVSLISGPCVFWLDGHYSGGNTGRGEESCPIWRELRAISDLMQHPFLIMIDDARCFGSDPDYPKLEAVEAFVRDHMPDFLIRVENDIIHILPRNLPE
jgi:hypothetical protein